MTIFRSNSTGLVYIAFAPKEFKKLVLLIRNYRTMVKWFDSGKLKPTKFLKEFNNIITGMYDHL